jgi:hypothetical protein
MERNEFNLGVQIVSIIIFFNKIDKLPIIRYHTRGSQKLTQYVSQISRAEIESISQNVTSSKIKFSKNVRAFIKTLAGPTIFLTSESEFLSGANKIVWHRKLVYRKKNT